MLEKAINAIQQNYLKTLIINLTTREYYVVKGCSKEFATIDEYWQWFADSEYIDPAYRQQFLEFISSAEVHSTLIYRRNNEGYVLMGIDPTDDYREDNKECVLYVRNINTIYLNEAKKVAEKVERIDGMTGLLNKKAFETDTTRTYRGNVGVAYIDLNGLKLVNDTLGHKEGDKLILSLVELLKESFPAYSIYKVGGDEFVVIAFNTKVREFIHTAEAFHRKMWKTEPIAAMGISADRAEDILDVIEDAEKQMYEDKQIYYEKYR